MHNGALSPSSKALVIQPFSTQLRFSTVPTDFSNWVSFSAIQNYLLMLRLSFQLRIPVPAEKVAKRLKGLSNKERGLSPLILLVTVGSNPLASIKWNSYPIIELLPLLLNQLSGCMRGGNCILRGWVVLFFFSDSSAIVREVTRRKWKSDWKSFDNEAYSQSGLKFSVWVFRKLLSQSDCVWVVFSGLFGGWDMKSEGFAYENWWDPEMQRVVSNTCYSVTNFEL